MFSIIIPAYNAEATLRKSVLSAVRQSLNSSFYEIIIIDDCSSDSTFSIMEDLKNHYPNIRIFKNEKNLRQGSARNRGIQLASKQYVVFLDADDWLKSDALELFKISIEKNTFPDIIYANFLCVTQFGDSIPIPGTLLRHDTSQIKHKMLGDYLTFCPTATAFKSEFLRNENLYFPEECYYEDVEFVIRCAFSANSCCGIADVVYYWVRNVESTTQSISETKIADGLRSVLTTYNFLEKRGEVQEFFKDYERMAQQFIKLLASRIRKYGGEERSKLLKILCNGLLSANLLCTQPKLTASLLNIAITQGNISQAVTQSSAQELMEATSGAVILLANIDYHIRHFVAIARMLQAFEIKCVVCDVSESSGYTTVRRVSDEERCSFSDIAYFHFNFFDVYPLFLNATAYVVSSDWGEFRLLMQRLRQRKIPTVAFYEGINDDQLLEQPRGKTPKEYPYRHADYLLLPGDYYLTLYKKYNPVVVGLPSLRALAAAVPEFPSTVSAVINCNFTYGVLEHKRNLFLETAMKACQIAGVPFIINQHPADKAKLANASISRHTIYEDIQQHTFLISRFSTCILEALAMGKPVIYHNPHGEKFPKFQENPMGAFEVTNSIESLVNAIAHIRAELEKKTDFRARAAHYLQHHAHIFEACPPEYYAAKAIQKIVAQNEQEFLQRTPYFAAYPQIPKVLPLENCNAFDNGFDLKFLACYKKASLLRKAIIFLFINPSEIKKFILGLFKR